MHRRQLKRPIHQRHITPAEARAIIRAPLPQAASQPPACAFHVTGAEPRIEVARSFAVELPFAGNIALAYPAGTVVHPRQPETWRGGDHMIIAAAAIGTAGNWRLLAMPSRDNAGHVTLGGFDLDPTGAILAGSFWDANLDDSCADQGTDPIATQIAQEFIDRARAGHADTTHLDLTRAGFSERQVMQHYEAAAGIAAEQLRDTDLSSDRVAYDRQQRVMRGANAVAGILLNDTAAVHAACRAAGLTTLEVGNLFDDIIGEAMRLVREARPALVAQ